MGASRSGSNSKTQPPPFISSLSPLSLFLSPLFPQFPVLSRLAVLWFIMHVSTAAQASPALFLCTLSWSLVEVPRYSYYLYKLCDIEPFYAHKWVRYSLFLVLYPTGIAGEIGNLLYALPGAAAINVSPGPGNALNVAYNHQVFLAILLLLYIPGSPLMIGHMWKERCKQLAAPTTTGASKDDRKSK